jgi:hypothetical protein
MTDEQIEAALNRYRPGAPSSSLRQRVLDAAARPDRVPLVAIDWSLAAVATLVIAVASFTGSDSRRESPSEIDNAWRQEVELLTVSAGGGAAARYFAELSLERPEPRVMLDTAKEDSW